MEHDRYDRFTAQLAAAAERDPDIVGLVAMGSMAARSHSPDEWSDHDLWVVTRRGTADRLRSEIDWLPDSDRIVGHFVETEHGRSIIYDDGHLIEMAVFEEHELEIATANDYRVLYDEVGLEGRMAAIADRTTREGSDPGRVDHAAGRFITTLIIGLGRYGRGELISAGELIRERALVALLRVLAAHGPAPAQPVLDNLDPHRRIEIAFPEIAERVEFALRQPVIVTAQTLLDLAREHLEDVLPALSPANLSAVQALLDRARTVNPRPIGLHHVLLAMPEGEEDTARHFYVDVLGLAEVEKPPVLEQRGGCWFRGPAIEIHLGVETPFSPARKAHPGLVTGDLDGLASRLDEDGRDIQWDPHYPGHRRFYTHDPFGNRLEFLQPD